MGVMCALCFIGCGEKEYVDKSNAVSRNVFDDPEFAKEQEAKDDAAGREHIEIPDDAETITIDGEKYIPIDSVNEIRPEDYDKNFILKHDIDVTGKGVIGLSNSLLMTNGANEPFTGKFNGNNYKVYGDRGWTLFGYIKDAEISNLIFSSKINNNPTNISVNRMALCGIAENSIIKNIVNYSTLGRTINTSSLGLILYLYKSTVIKVQLKIS